MIDKNTIALQLYSIREELAPDFASTIRRVAAMGYQAVEAASLPDGLSAEAAKALFDELGINVFSTHSRLPLGADQDGILEHVKALDVDYVVCPWLDPDPYFASVDGIKTACEMLNEANVVVKDNGMTLAYHNHWFEMEAVEGKIAYQHMLDYLDDDIMFEFDVYWAKVAGLNPVDVINELGSRAPILHIKDGPANNRDEAMTAVGDGNLDIPAILQASSADWYIVELDRCDTDMLTAVEASYDYLVRQSS